MAIVHKDELYDWVGIVDRERNELREHETDFPKAYAVVPQELAENLNNALIVLEDAMLKIDEYLGREDER